MNSNCVSLTLLLCIICSNSFSLNKYVTLRGQVQLSKDIIKLHASDSSSDNTPFQPWFNSKYSAETVNRWFVTIDKPLLTIGRQGPTANTINSLTELVRQHGRIRIKIASDRIDSLALANELAENESVSKQAELLAVKKREFMFGSTDATVMKNIEKRNALKMKEIESSKISTATIKCYNCGELGHYSSACPAPKTIISKTVQKQTAKGKFPVKRQMT